MVRPLLKWAGGKRQIVRALISHKPQSFSGYFEPFFGGGAFYFTLVEEKPGITSVISDINYDLYSLYNIVRKRPYEMSESISSLEFGNNSDDYYSARETFNSAPTVADPVRKAALLVYLNRHCFNGLYRVNSAGEFNVPFGKYKKPYIPDLNHILSVSESLQAVNLLHGDFQYAVGGAGEGDFVYFDPPYDPLSVSSSFTSYSQESFQRTDQERLASIVRDLDRKGVNVMVSNSDTPVIRELYSGLNFKEIPAGRAINSKASARGKINELIITNYRI